MRLRGLTQTLARGRLAGAGGLVVALPLALLSTVSPAQAEPLTYGEALRTAMRESPDLAAKAFQVESARSAAIPAGALPDPKLFGGLESFPVTGPNAVSFDDDMTMVTVGVMQEFPNRNKRRARTARAQADIEAASLNLLAQGRDVLEETAQAWLELFYTERRIDALTAVEREIRLAAETVPALVGSGTALPADAVEPAIETAALANRRAEYQSEREQARAKLRRWIGAAADEPLASTAPTFSVHPTQLRAALDDHPALRAYEPALARAAAEVAEARAAKRPDWSVQAAFHGRNPDYGQMVSAQVTVDLPLFATRRQDPLIAAKVAQASRVRAEQAAARRRLTAELERTLAEYVASAEALKRTREQTLPLARQKVELQLASFRAGRIAFEPVLRARRERVETELKIIDLEAETAKAAARLAVYFGSDPQ